MKQQISKDQIKSDIISSHTDEVDAVVAIAKPPCGNPIGEIDAVVREIRLIYLRDFEMIVVTDIS